MSVTTPYAAATERLERRVPESRVVTVLLVYLGFAFAVPQWWARIPVVTLPLVLAAGLGWLGWRRITFPLPLRAYLVAAALLSIALTLSAVSLWDGPATAWVFKVAMWALFIVPGLSVVLRSAVNRRAFVFGLGAGIAYYGIVRAFWLVTGTPLSSQNVVMSADGSIYWFFGVNRNDLDIQALFVLPLLWLGTEGKRVPLRRLMSAFIVFWLVTSGGRSGLALLPVMAVAYVVIVPGIGRRLKAFAALAMVALVVVAGLVSVRDPTEVSATRVSDALSGKRTTSDERRVLLNNRAWNLGWSKPLVGNGYGRLLGADDESLAAASTFEQQRAALESGVHNRYLWMFASVGLPATLAYLATIAIALAFLLRDRADRDARWITIAFVGIVLLLWFHTGHQELTDYPLAMALGACCRSSRVAPA